MNLLIEYKSTEYWKEGLTIAHHPNLELENSVWISDSRGKFLKKVSVNRHYDSHIIAKHQELIRRGEEGLSYVFNEAENRAKEKLGLKLIEAIEEYTYGSK